MHFSFNLSMNNRFTIVPRLKTYFDLTQMENNAKSSQNQNSSSSSNRNQLKTSLSPDAIKMYSDEKINSEVERNMESMNQTVKILTERLQLYRMRIHTLEISKTNDTNFLRHQLKLQQEENKKLKFSLEEYQNRLHILEEDNIQKANEIDRMHKTIRKLKEMLDYEITMNDR